MQKSRMRNLFIECLFVREDNEAEEVFVYL